MNAAKVWLLLALLTAVTGGLVVLATPAKQNEHPAAVQGHHMRKAFEECREVAAKHDDLAMYEAVFKACMNAKGFSL